MASIRKRTWTAAGTTRTAWVVDYVDQHGKRRLRTFDRKRDADDFMTTARAEVRQGTHTPDSVSVTVREAGEAWIDHCALNDLEASTIEQRKAHLRLHINPRIGETRLSRLTAPAARAFADELLRDLSRPMAQKVMRTLKTLLKHAMEAGRVAQNVAAGIRIETRERARADGTIPTKAELTAILAAARGRWRPLIITAAFTGLRASELRGLTWANVDLDRRMIRVAQRADKWGLMGNPKSRTSRREIPLSPIVLATLTAWQKECPTGDAGLVFPNKSGKVELHTNIVRRGWHPTQVAAGVFGREGPIITVEGGGAACALRGRYGFHALRHFYASWLIEQGFAPKRVQSLLGHSSITMTFDTYGHLFPNLDDDHAKLAAAERGFGLISAV